MLRQYKIIDNRIVANSDQDAPILVFINPDESEKRMLIDQYMIDEHTLNSSLDPDELSRPSTNPITWLSSLSAAQHNRPREHFF
jgi:magnesium transporter